MKRITALALVLVLIFALAACGGKGGAVPGTYKLTGMMQDGEDLSEQIAAMEALGMEITLVLKEDGTGYLNMLGEQADLTWDAKSITVEGDAEPYTVDGDSLTLKEGNTSMTFTLKK